MAASHIQSTADDSDIAICQDTFPEVAFFEVPSELSNKTVSSKTRDLVKHPAFREISAINGEINRMAVKSLKVELDALDLDSRGTKDVLRKRLKAYERRRVLTAAGIEDPNTPRQHYTHLLVIDFEATCEEHQTKDYVHEIIEFPAVLVRIDDVAVVAEFHSLVRPQLNPNLSPFCIQLTGILQDSVDSAPTFPEVLSQFEQWLTEQGVTDDGRSKLAVATDGPWDMARFLLMQCNVSKLPFPPWARSWINLRKIFSNFYVTKRLCLSEMLSTLGLEFRGRPHCGLDDARNIAAIAEVLVRDGAAPRVNETIAHLPRSAPPSLKGSSVSSVTLKEFETSERRRLRASGRNARPGAVASGNDGGDDSINTFITTDTNTKAYAVDCNSVGGGTFNTIDGVCGAVGQMELSVDSLSRCNINVERQMNGNYEDVEGGSEAVMCNGHSESSSNAVVQKSAGYTNGYVAETVLDGEGHHKYQDDESCESFLPCSAKDPSSYDANCEVISSSRKTNSPTHSSATTFSSNILNSSYCSPHHSNRIMHVQRKTQNAGGTDVWSHLNGFDEAAPVDSQDSSSIGDIQNSGTKSPYPIAPCVSSPSSNRNTTLPLVSHSADNAGGDASSHQQLLHCNSMPYINIEYSSSGVCSTASSASPRSVSRQSTYAEHNSDHHSTSSHPQDNGSNAHQALAEPSLNKNASGIRRFNNRRHNNNNNQANPACTSNSSGTEMRPPQHRPLNKGSLRYPYRNVDDSAANSSSRGKRNKKTGGKPGNSRMGGTSAASFFSHATTPSSPASISMDLSDANEFPVLGSMKRCPR